MTLVNTDPHVVLHQKTHVPFTGIFVGRSFGLPAPCASTLSIGKLGNHIKQCLRAWELIDF